MIRQNPRVWITEKNGIATSVIHFLGCIRNSQEQIEREADIGIIDDCRFTARVTEVMYNVVIQTPILESRSRYVFSKLLCELDIFNMG